MHRPLSLMVFLAPFLLQGPADVALAAAEPAVSAATVEANASDPFDGFRMPHNQLICTCWETNGEDRNLGMDGGSASPPVPALPAPTKKKIVLHRIDFEVDSAVIRPEAAPELNEAAALLAGDGAVVVIVHEPADSMRSAAYRSLLARRRAKAVRHFLMVRGIAAKRVTVGELAQPRVSPTAEFGHAQSHATELHFE